MVSLVSSFDLEWWLMALNFSKKITEHDPTKNFFEKKIFEPKNSKNAFFDVFWQKKIRKLRAVSSSFDLELRLIALNFSKEKFLVRAPDSTNGGAGAAPAAAGAVSSIDEHASTLSATKS